MRILLFIVLLGVSKVNAQNLPDTSRWHFLNRFQISAYFLNMSEGIKDLNFGANHLYEGNDLTVNVLSYQMKRHEIGVSTGMFYVGRIADRKENPYVKYLYFPLNLSYTYYSSNHKLYGQFVASMPILRYEDAKSMTSNDLWLSGDDLAGTYQSYIQRKRIVTNHLKFGYQFEKHFGLTTGLMTYFYATSRKEFNVLARLSLGLEFRL